MKLKKAEKIVLVALAVLLAGALIFPIRVNKTLAVQGKLLPVKEWLLVREGGAAVTVIEKQYLPLKADMVSLFSAERGDVMQLQVVDSLKSGSRVVGGTLLARVMFNEGPLGIARLERRIAESRAELALYSSGDKRAIRNEAQQRLSLAQESLNLAQKELDRQQGLFESGLLARAQYEQALSLRDIRRAEVAIRQAELENVSSGAKPELLERTRGEIIGYQQELAVLKQRQALGNLQAPFSGTVTFSAFSDTLVQLTDSSRCLLIPVAQEKANAIRVGQDCRFTINDTMITAKLAYITPAVTDVQGKPSILVIARLAQPFPAAALHTVWTGEMETPGRTLRSLALDMARMFAGQ